MYRKREDNMSETNLDKIKEIAIDFLYLKVEPTPEFPMFLMHPFFSTPVVNIPDENDDLTLINILDSKENLDKARKIYKENIMLCDNVFQIIMAMRDADKRTFFMYIKDYLSNEDFSKLLKEIWICTESPNFDINVKITEMKQWFKKADKKILMDEDDWEIFDKMPDEVTIYRGITSDEYYKALSWTTNKKQAEFFATRYDSDGTIFTAKINKKDILAAFESESEVIVDYDKIYDIEEE